MKRPFILPFFYHKSAATCQIDPYKVSNSKLKPNLCNCVKTEVIESMAPPQQPHKQGTILFGHLVVKTFPFFLGHQLSANTKNSRWSTYQTVRFVVIQIMFFRPPFSNRFVCQCFISIQLSRGTYLSLKISYTFGKHPFALKKICKKALEIPLVESSL